MEWGAAVESACCGDELPERSWKHRDCRSDRKYGVEGVNENGQYLVDICAERGLFLSSTFFQHKMIHRYTWARGNKRSMIDYIAVDSSLRREVEDAKVVRGLWLGPFCSCSESEDEREMVV